MTDELVSRAYWLHPDSCRFRVTTESRTRQMSDRHRLSPSTEIKPAIWSAGVS